MSKPRIIIVSGPTAVGKTKLCVNLAQQLNAEIISADSRQFYKEMNIGTAKPDTAEMQDIKHHFIGHISIHQNYNVNDFEKEAIQLINQLHSQNKQVIVTGGSGLYLDILCYGFDTEIPDSNTGIRKKIADVFNKEGLSGLQKWYQQLDPEGFQTIDIHNKNRLQRAIEISLLTNKPASQIKKGNRRQRPFDWVKIALNRNRNELYNRINLRVDNMIQNGLLEEARQLYPYKHLKALNTVGYKELFNYFDGIYTQQQAIEKIKTHSRRYAKRQLTWFKKDPEWQWFHPEQFNDILNHIHQKI